jgi:hypothetical protein
MVPGVKSASDGSYCFQWNDAAIAKIKGNVTTLYQKYFGVIAITHAHTQHSTTQFFDRCKQTHGTVSLIMKVYH